jgi:hypothetical protein
MSIACVGEFACVTVHSEDNGPPRSGGSRRESKALQRPLSLAAGFQGRSAECGITKVSPYPVRLGTTYLDAGLAGTQASRRHAV